MECPLSTVAPNPSDDGDFTVDTTADTEVDVHSSDAQGTVDTPPEDDERVHSSNPVVDRDLTQLRKVDPIPDTQICPQFTEAPATQAETPEAPPSAAAPAPPEGGLSELLRHRPEWDSFDSAFDWAAAPS